jgi:hypothetical protein
MWLRFLLIAALVFSCRAIAQSAHRSSSAKDRRSESTRDLSGIWDMHMPDSSRPYINFAFTPTEPPMTAWSVAKLKKSKPSFGPKMYSIEETNDPVYKGCYPPGVPRVYLHPFPMQLVQMPGEVLMLFEYDGLRRQIFTDGRPHDTRIGPTWMGDSIGHWEGDTLVVDTIGLNDKTWLDRMGHPHSDALHVVERFQRVDHHTLEIRMVFEDPKAYTKPWGTKLIYQLKPDWKLMEQFCEDNDTFLEVEKKGTAPAK